MTREEAIKIFNEVLLFGKAPCTQVEFEELAKMSIQALEQEPTDKKFTKADIDAIVTAINAHWELIIDEIRAEIRANSFYVMPQYGRIIREADVLHILDKYKAESEDT